LRGTYAELNPLFAELPADIDRQARQVRVRYSETMPPRIAQWRPVLGCAQLPIGSGPEAAQRLPSIAGMTEGPDTRVIDATPWPTGDRNAAARPRGDAAALNRAVANAFDRRTYGQGSETTALLVVHGGKIVAERYRPDFNMHNGQRTWSVAKSIAATVIGRAVQLGLVRVEDQVGLAGAQIAVEPLARPSRPWPRVPEWNSPDDPRGIITIDQLLRMSSGLNSDFAGNRTDALYFGGIGIAEQAASLPLIHRPGTVFRYANNDIVLATRALQHGLGDSGKALAFPYEELFRRIGMTRTFAETDHNGHFVMSSQVWTTARDLARLGLLHANDGMWEGERVLPSGWNDYVRRRGPAQPARGYGYGAGWWTFPADAGLPEDAFIAQGNRGQYVVVVPSRQVVIVRRGFDSTEARFDPAALTRDVLAALR
jgi:CubicO group peptidase (beta-lactamase class C family)